MDDPSLDQTRLTRAEEVLGTPASMSPEQAAGAGAADLDARTDIYGLGVLLYELLTGRLPFDPKLPADELRRAIRANDPPKPSSQVAPKRAGALKGDLDWIVMRCLEKEPERRYSSVSALLRDLERHDQDEAVEAGPPDWRYRVGKFIRRRRLPLAAGVIVLLSILGASVISFVQMRQAQAEGLAARKAEGLAEQRRMEAQAERDAAQAISGFLTGILNSADPEIDGPEITFAELLDRATSRLRADDSLRPDRKATVYRTLLDAYEDLGVIHEHLDLAEESLEFHRSTLGPEHPDTREAQASLANYYLDSRRLDECESLLRALLQSAEGQKDMTQLAYRDLAICLAYQGKLEEAESLLSDVIRALPEGHYARADANRRLSDIFAATGRADQAIPHGTRLLQQRTHQRGPDHPKTLGAVVRLARAYQGAGQFHQVVDLLEPTIPKFIACFGPDHPETLSARSRLNIALSFGRRKEDAARMSEEVLEDCQQRLGADHQLTLTAMHDLAICYKNLKKGDEAIKLEEEAHERSAEVLGARHPLTTKFKSTLTIYYLSSDRPERGVALAREMVTTSLVKPSVSPPALRPRTYASRLPRILKITAEDLPKPLAEAVSRSENTVDLPEHESIDLSGIGVRLESLGEPALAIPFQEKHVTFLYGINPYNDIYVIGIANLANCYAGVGRLLGICFWRKGRE